MGHKAEGGLGACLLGPRNALAGIAPPSGACATADVVHMSSSVDNLAIGGRALANAESAALITKLNLTHAPAMTLWGGRPAVTATLPVMSGALEFSGLSRGGLTGAFPDDDFGLGDLTVTPMLGLDAGPWCWLAAISASAPTGCYEKTSIDFRTGEAQALSCSKNRWAFMPPAAWSWYDPASGREASGALALTVSLKNEATDGQTALERSFEATVMKHLPSGFAMGVAGCACEQLDDASGERGLDPRGRPGQDPARAGVRDRAGADLRDQGGRDAGVAEAEIYRRIRRPSPVRRRRACARRRHRRCGRGGDHADAARRLADARWAIR